MNEIIFRFTAGLIGILLIVLFVILLAKIIYKGVKSGVIWNDKIKITTTPTGIIFGRLIPFAPLFLCSPEEKEGHIFVVGGSGTGKTSAILIPTLRSWKGNFYALDISGDIATNVTTNVIIFGPDNKNTIPYSPFTSVDLLSTTEAKHEKIAQIALLLIPKPIGVTDDTSQFFCDGGRKFLTAGLICGYDSGYDFIETCKRIHSLGHNDFINKISNSSNPKAMEYLTSFVDTNERNVAGCKAYCDDIIALFVQNHNLANSIHRPARNEFAFTPALLESQSVIVAIEENKLDLYSPLLALITCEMLDYFSARKPTKHSQKILFAIDEFARQGRLEITNALRTCRKKGVRIMVLSQSLADLDSLYGTDKRRAFVDNFDFRLVLSARDPDCQDFFARSAGTNAKSEGFNHQRYQIEPALLGRLRFKFVLYHNLGYIFLFKNYHFSKFKL